MINIYICCVSSDVVTLTLDNKIGVRFFKIHKNETFRIGTNKHQP